MKNRTHKIYLKILNKTFLILFPSKYFNSFQKKYHLDSAISQPNFEILITETDQKQGISYKLISKSKSVMYFSQINPPNFRLLNFYLKFLLELIMSISDKKIAFLHASSVVVNQFAYIFCGNSGQGKSTIAAFFGKKSLLADDLVIITKDRNGRFWATNSSLEKKRHINHNNKKFLVKKIFFIEKSLKNRVQLLNGEQILNNFNKSNFFLLFIRNFIKLAEKKNKKFHAGKTTKKMIVDKESFFYDIVKFVRVKKLRFSKNRKIIPLVLK